MTACGNNVQISAMIPEFLKTSAGFSGGIDAFRGPKQIQNPQDLGFYNH